MTEEDIRFLTDLAVREMWPHFRASPFCPRIIKEDNLSWEHVCVAADAESDEHIAGISSLVMCSSVRALMLRQARAAVTVSAQVMAKTPGMVRPDRA